jgi:hypothetical protein
MQQPPMPPQQQYQPPQQFRPPKQPLKKQPKLNLRKRLWLLVVAVFLIAIVMGLASRGQNQQPAPTTQATQQPTTPTATTATINKAIPTAKPTPIPTQKPTPRPQPTQPPVHPTPTKPACQAVNNNPWCYDFNPGKYITYPPSGFCNYFNCIPTFYGSDDPGDGYIAECNDGTYSQSGGESGACSSHGGVMRPLYSH